MPRSLRTIPRVSRGRTALALGLTGAMGLSVVSGVNASSHREAPMIAQDPAADNTDVYAFVSPDAPDTVTLIANWIPAEDPAAGPTYYRFGEDVLYSIHIDNNGDAVEDVTYEWRFRDEILNPDTILYATGQITSLDDEDYNFRQRYDLFEVRDGARRALITNAILPPNNLGIATPDYEAITEQATLDLPGGGQTFTGQRDDAFFGDIGSIFDLGQLRPFLPAYQPAPRDAQEPVDFFAGYNVHTTSIQVPISSLVQGDEPVIGIWSTSSRPKVRVFSQNNGANPVNRGRFVQISRLGNPLVNEVVVPFGLKDTFNALAPRNDAAALSQPADEDGVTIPLVQRPELADLITALYGIETPDPPRNDLVSIFLTGIEGVNQPANVKPAEMLRLNTSIAPTGSDINAQNRLGLLAGENDGFPNGRRLGDDVIDIGLRAVAGGTPFTPEFTGEDRANDDLADGVDGNDSLFRTSFPYQANPWQGYGENNELRGRTMSGASTVTEPGAR
jgi:hypothetical protein